MHILSVQTSTSSPSLNENDEWEATDLDNLFRVNQGLTGKMQMTNYSLKSMQEKD